MDMKLSPILFEIEQALEELTSEEVDVLSRDWPALENLVDRPDALQEEFISLLLEIVSRSSTLISHGFPAVLSKIVRYSPNSVSKTKNLVRGLPPIHNEVIRIGEKLKAIRSQSR